MSLICFTIQKYAFNQDSRLFHSLNLILKTIIFILLTSIRFKVFRLSSITTTATIAPLRINGNYVGAYRIRPPWRRTYQRKSLAQNEASFSNTFAAVVFIFAHIRAYAIRPYSFRRIINYHDALTAVNTLIKWWYFVRRYCFHVRSHRGVCDTPLRFS